MCEKCKKTKTAEEERDEAWAQALCVMILAMSILLSILINVIFPDLFNFQ